nr:MAG TPA: hypothetical protein [Caudoviricetes sp.]
MFIQIFGLMVYGNNMEPFKKFGTAGVNFKSLLMKSMDTSYPLVIFFYEPTASNSSL